MSLARFDPRNGMAIQPDKRIIIIAGPNGAGKTTFATEYLPNEADTPTFINADMIAAGLNPFQPELAAFQAGRMMLEMIEACVSQGREFRLREHAQWKRLRTNDPGMAGAWIFGETIFLASFHP